MKAHPIWRKTHTKNLADKRSTPYLVCIARFFFYSVASIVPLVQVNRVKLSVLVSISVCVPKKIAIDELGSNWASEASPTL